MKRSIFLFVLFIFSVSQVFAQKYKIETSAYVYSDDHNIECTSKYEVNVFSTSNNVIGNYTKYFHAKERKPYYDSNTFYVEGSIGRVECFGEHRDDPTNRLQGCYTVDRGASSFDFTPDALCNTIRPTGKFMGRNCRSSYVDIKITPVEVQAFFREAGSSEFVSGMTGTLSNDQPIEIKATEGYVPEVYQLWEYRFVGDGIETPFQPFPDGLRNGNDLRFNGIELLGNDFFNYAGRSRVEIRLNFGCGYSDTIAFNLQLTAPVITHCEVEDWGCPGAGNIRLALELNRELLPGEELRIREKPTSVEGDFFSDSAFEVTGNRCILTGNYNGEYLFKLSAQYQGEGMSSKMACFSGLPGHSHTFSVTPLPPIRFTGRPVVTDLTCPNGNEGSITIKAQGGVGQHKIKCVHTDGTIYESEFSVPVAAGEDSEITITGLKSGEYEIFLYDSNGCEAIETDITEILEPEDPLRIVSQESYNPITPEGDSGFARIFISGGTLPYRARIKKDGEDFLSLNGISHEGNPILAFIDHLPAGEFSVEILDESGCSVSTEFTLSDPPPIFITITETAYIECGGDHTGELTAEVEGGVTPYTYQWYQSSGHSEYAVGANSPSLSGIPAGTYRLKVTDNLGNVVWSGFTEQTEESRITATFNNPVLKCRGDNDGALEVSFSGGSGNYSYEWLTGNPAHTGQTITGLSEGEYSIKITDDAGCQVTETGYVQQPEPMSMNPVVRDPSCSGSVNGSISLEVSGGTAPYVYHWSDGSPETNNRITSLDAGEYSVTVDDLHGCEQLSETFTLTAPEPLVLTRGVARPASSGKNDGYIQVYISGGTTPYIIHWYDQNNQPVQPESLVKERENLYLSKISGLSVGVYKIVVKDARYTASSSYSSCMAELTIDVSEIPPLTATISLQSPISCFGREDGKLNAIISGGLPFESDEPYQYTWYRNDSVLNTNGLFLENLKPGNYRIRVKDDNGTEILSPVFALKEPALLSYKLNINHLLCHADSTGWVKINPAGGTAPFEYQWETGAVSQSLNHLPAGSYPFTVTDSRGCTVAGEALVTEPDGMKVQPEIRIPACFGDTNGRIDLSVTGGSAPYSYLWEDESANPYLDSIGSGNYIAKITDANGCNTKEFFSIPARTKPEIILKEIKDPLAFGRSDGFISIQIEGGESPYRLLWTDEQGNTVHENSVSDGDSPEAGLFNIPKGTYHLRVEDVNTPPDLLPGELCGCIDTASYFIDEPPKLEVSIEATQAISCYGQNNGELEVHARGGVPNPSGPPYVFHWFKNGQPAGIREDTTFVAGAGNYQVTVIDANGIEALSEIYEFGQPDSLKLVFSAADLRCSHDSDGWAEVEVTGGTAPYTYDWSTGSRSARIENVPRGAYFVHVTDQLGCETTGYVRIVQPDSIRVDAELIEPSCYNGNNGQIRLRLSGGQAPYSYYWEDHSNTLTRTGLAAGEYTFTVTDINGCGFETETFRLGQPDSIVVDLGKDRLLCSDQVHELTARISEPFQSYTWYNESGKIVATGETAVLSEAGAYRARVITARGCQGEGIINIRREGREISSDFAVATQVPVNEEIIVVNISVPDPERIEWILPEGAYPVVVDSSFHKLELIFEECGDYIIGMKSYSGECYETSYKSISVMNKDQIPDYRESSGMFLKSFVASPNPTRGEIKVALELREKADAELRLVESGTGKTIETRTLQNGSAYVETFHIRESPGVYILLLNTAKGRQFTKIIKH